VSQDGEQTRAMAGELDYELLMLDLNLPRVDGVTILRQLRNRKPSMPILILTSRNRVEDRVQCLDLGADDYLGQPFPYAELSARIRALLRRSHLPAASMLTVDDLKLDRVERRVERASKRIELTSKEFGLLEYLMLNSRRRVTRAMIIEHVWNLSFDTSTNVVDVYVDYGLRITEVLAGSQCLSNNRELCLLYKFLSKVRCTPGGNACLRVRLIAAVRAGFGGASPMEPAAGRFMAGVIVFRIALTTSCADGLTICQFLLADGRDLRIASRSVF
jgi:two-component system, OmpR family, copper resistance phosphate regulon response regulator CusR